MDDIADILARHGPLTGKKIIEKTNMNMFNLWKLCNKSERIVLKTVGRKYLRFDKHVDGWARLSPSIIREFYGYTVVGLENQLPEVMGKTALLQQEIKEISRRKYNLAQDVVKKAVGHQEASQLILTNACFMIAGDVAYEMSHVEPRPEFTTGELVNGSDLDIVIITVDLPENITQGIDAAIYDQKAYLLRTPCYREEIDYVIKNISDIKTQLKFDSFKSMVASKILYEGKFLYGNPDLFHEIKKIIVDAGIPEKLAAMEKMAVLHRDKARLQLLSSDDTLCEEKMELFSTREEKEEFF